ncbi:MAG: AAA family ATPase [Candidatus Saccharimonadales bacterium]
MSKVIILRGNSGSGKSTVAKELIKSIKHKTVIVEQDYYRVHMFFPLGEHKEEVRELMLQNVLYCLAHDYDILWVSIFHKPAAQDYFEEFFKNHHPADNFIFSFQTSFEESIKRHQTRPQKNEFGIKDMKEWYKPTEPLGYDFEFIIPESNTIQQTVKYIKDTAKI